MSDGPNLPLVLEENETEQWNLILDQNPLITDLLLARVFKRLLLDDDVEAGTGRNCVYVNGWAWSLSDSETDAIEEILRQRD